MVEGEERRGERVFSDAPPIEWEGAGRPPCQNPFNGRKSERNFAQTGDTHRHAFPTLHHQHSQKQTSTKGDQCALRVQIESTRATRACHVRGKHAHAHTHTHTQTYLELQPAGQGPADTRV